MLLKVYIYNVNFSKYLSSQIGDKHQGQIFKRIKSMQIYFTPSKTIGEYFGNKEI